MFELNATRMVYLHRDAIDFRKNVCGHLIAPLQDAAI